MAALEEAKEEEEAGEEEEEEKPQQIARQVAARYQCASVVRYSCNAGFTLSGPPTLTCGVNGAWSAAPPTCISK